MENTLRGIAQYARKNYLSYWIILGIDTVISVLCSLVAYVVIHYMAHVPMTDWMLCKFVCVSLVASVAGALLFHTYRNTIRFSQARELWRIMCAVLF
ncbi:polysaccharide biosynthesis protein, partial [Bacteroides ovatus]|nr:polysaccharide biosynthesis protein [Bacteroides ovatus]